MNKIIKLIILAVLALALALSFCSCKDDDNTGDSSVGDNTGDNNTGNNTGNNNTGNNGNNNTGSCKHANVTVKVEGEKLTSCTEGADYVETVYCDDCNTVISRENKHRDPRGHEEIAHVAKAPTCSEAGYAAYVTCARCDYTTYTEIPALEHDIVNHEGKEQTCTEGGWYAYETCNNCDFNSCVPLPALEHDIVSYPSKVPTCTEVGYNGYEFCSRCDYTTYVEIPALGHDEVTHAAEAATCDEFGCNEYVTCARCDYSTYFDNIIDPLGHDKIEHGAKEETCTEDGWDAYETCSRCDYSTKEDNIIEARHIIENNPGELPTCTESGCNMHQYCTRCDYKSDNYEAYPATGHNWATEKGKEVTCTEWGYEAYQYCTNDGCNEDNRVVIEALGHNIVEYPGKAPTCEDGGWKAYEICDRCKAESTSTYEALDPIGHSPITNSKEPTCTEGGYTERTCSRCDDYYFYEEREAFGHDNVTYARVEPTCTTIGYEELSYCRRCELIENGKYPSQTMLKTLDHNFVGGECTVCHNREGSSGLEFELVSDTRSYAVVGLGTCTDKVIVIPATYNNLPISQIEQLAFMNSDIVSVCLPSTLDPTILCIDASVFMNCYNLVEIINNSSIEASAYNFFIESQLLADHKGESKIQRVGEFYFFVEGGEATLVSYAGTAKEIELPASFSGNSYKIHDNAFRESEITKITVPITVTEIGEWALHTTSSLRSLTVQYLGTKAEWEAIDIDATNKQWIKEVVYHYGKAHTVVSVDEKPAGCEEIGHSAYEYCTACDYATEKVEYEPTGHFYEYVDCRFCGKEIVYSEGLDFEISADGNYYVVTGIGECTDDYVIVPSHHNGKPVQEIGPDAFAGLEILGVHLPVTVTRIGDSAFMNCYMLKYASLGYEVELIDRYAFGFCEKLVAIKIGGAYLKNINSGAFDCCEALTDVYYNASEEEWNEVIISEYDNDSLTNANIHFGALNN